MHLTLSLAGAILCAGTTTNGLETVATLQWSKLTAQGELPAAVAVIPSAGAKAPEYARVTHEKDGPVKVRLFEVARPRISKARYALLGEVRYEGVQGKGYLEMWSFFSTGGRFFSRTLGEVGPMRHLAGTSDWRAFQLPFQSNDKLGAPTRLVVNLVLPGPGQVDIRSLSVVQPSSGEALPNATGAWWTSRQGGLVGGILGGLVGLIGALIGVLSSLGRARSLVLGMMRAVIVLGVGMLGVGAAAFAAGQPWHVHYPLLLPGVVGVSVCAGLLGQVRRRYEDLELRKIASLDAI